MVKKKLRLALFISGGGTTASAIIQACRTGKLDIKPVLVVASKSSIAGIERVKAAGIKDNSIKIINPKDYKNTVKFGELLLQICNRFETDLIGQYGWMPLTPVNLIKAYEGKIINQHPGPLDTGRPDFGGKGMYGRRVHAAVLYFRRVTKRDFWTEATTHLVTEKFDKGEVIKRKRLVIKSADTVEDLQLRLLPVEHKVQISTLADFATGTVQSLYRKSPLVRDNELKILEDAKRIAAIYYPYC